MSHNHGIKGKHGIQHMSHKHCIMPCSIMLALVIELEKEISVLFVVTTITYVHGHALVKR